MSLVAVPMSYHGPGWRIVAPDGADYMLWFPREAEVVEFDVGPPIEREARFGYAVCSSRVEASVSDVFRSGLPSLEAALALLPDEVAAVFRRAAEQASW